MKPLEEVTVLDFTQFTSGPVCTYIFADYGAEVIKLENPPLGDQNHYSGPFVNKHSQFITSLNHNKKSVLINMKNEEHKALFLKMAETADIVVDNFKAGTLEKFGITWEVLQKTNPRIIWTSISGYGQTGPWSKRTAYDITIQAASGLVSVSGDVGGAPVKAGVSMSDFCSGLQACCGSMAALIDAKRTGKGRRIEMAMLDSSFSLCDQFVTRYFATGEVMKPFGREHVNFCPYNSYECADDREMLICTRTDEQFRALCGALSVPEASYETYATLKKRLAHRKEVNALVADAVKKVAYDDLASKLEAADVPYGSIKNVLDVIDSDQVNARHMMRNGSYRDGTNIRIVGTPVKCENVDDAEEVSYCFKGEDTIEVLGNYEDKARVHALFDEVIRDSDEKWAEKTADV